MKNRLLVIIGLVAAAMIVLVAMNRTINSPNRQKNGFDRNVAKVMAEEVSRKDLGELVYRIAGIKGDSVFCYGQKPGKVYLFTNNLSRMDTFSLDLPASVELESLFYTFVSFPEVYVAGGNTKTWIHGNLLSKQYTEQKIPSGGSFSKVVFLSPEVFVARVIDPATLHAKFKKINMATKEVVVEKQLSEELGDAGFIYDGNLSFDTTTGLFSYVAHYANRVTCFDTLLNLVYHSSTIDTTYTPAIQVTRKATSLTQAKPPVTINEGSFSANAKFYVISRLIADNEGPENGPRTRVIDEYDQKNGKYIRSFYIPRPEKQLMATCAFNDKQSLVVLNEKAIYLYNLKTPS